MEYIKGGTQKEYYTDADITNTSCLLCDSPKYELIKKEKKVLGVVRCKQCNLIYINPRLKNPEQVYWGEKKKYEEEGRFIFSGKKAHHRDKNYLEDLKIIEKHKPSGKFLDIGTNMGTFLRLAKNRKWDLLGIEPSKSLCEIAQEKFGLPIINDFVENVSFSKNTFDIITMTDVFEHLVNPKTVLQSIRLWLKEDGILFIKVPNAKFNLLKFYVREKIFKRPSDLTFDSYEHVAHYTNKTLTLMLSHCGFKPLKMYVTHPVQIPVWHFYVGQYFLYPSPAILDLKKYLGRESLYYLSLIENFFLIKIGYLSQNIVVVAQKQEHAI